MTTMPIHIDVYIDNYLWLSYAFLRAIYTYLRPVTFYSAFVHQGLSSAKGNIMFIPLVINGTRYFSKTYAGSTTVLLATSTGEHLAFYSPEDYRDGYYHSGTWQHVASGVNDAFLATAEQLLLAACTAHAHGQERRKVV